MPKDDKDAFPRVGDVLLVRGAGKKSSTIVGAQKVLYQRARSSHVALCLGGGAFIHSTAASGVHIEFFPAILSESQSNWTVLRLKALDGAGREKLFSAANYFLEQGYNRGFMLPENATSSFCSEFAAKAYRQAGFEIISGKKPSQVFPADFDREADGSEEWLDVTDEYRSWLGRFEADTTLGIAEFKFLKSQIEHLKARARGGEIMLRDAEKDFPSAGMKKAVTEIRDELEKHRKMRFWDEKRE